MRRKPHTVASCHQLELTSPPTSFDPNKWVNAEEAATLLRKFRRRDGKPSVGAIRNMVYRKQIVAYKILGRLLFLREELDGLVVMSPITKGA